MLGLGTPTNGDSTISGTFTAPWGASTLSFWYKMTCPDTVTYDWATATLLDNTVGGAPSTALQRTCVSNAWTQVTLGVIAGHNYTLSLTSHDDNYGADPTFTLFDDVVVSSSATPLGRKSLCFPGRSVYALGKVRAATFSPDDQHLWVVDETPDQRVRLSRIGFDGFMDEVTSWSNSGVYDLAALTLDHDGSVLVTQAKSNASAFVTGRVQLDTNQVPTLTARYSVSRQLMSAPMVTPTGYAFVTTPTTLPSPASVQRVNALPSYSGTCSALSETF